MSRAALAAVGALALTLGAAAGCGGDAEPAGGAPRAEDGAARWAGDDRFVTLLDPCERRGHYDGDTSAMLPALVGKLETGELEVQRNLREELARAGEPAVEELSRLVDRRLTDPLGTPCCQLDAVPPVVQPPGPDSKPSK